MNTQLASTSRRLEESPLLQARSLRVRLAPGPQRGGGRNPNMPASETPKRTSPNTMSVSPTISFNDVSMLAIRAVQLA